MPIGRRIPAKLDFGLREKPLGSLLDIRVARSVSEEDTSIGILLDPLLILVHLPNGSEIIQVIDQPKQVQARKPEGYLVGWEKHSH